MNYVSKNKRFFLSFKILELLMRIGLLPYLYELLGLFLQFGTHGLLVVKWCPRRNLSIMFDYEIGSGL